MQRLASFLSTASQLLLLALLATPLQAAPGTIHQYQLDNGMRILVREDHRAPVVQSMVWYGVGSSYEHSGITGISHVLEHMMFKGTPRYPGGSFSQIISDNGGQENAFTSYDYTAYYQYLAADRLPVALKLEADRMRNLRLAEADFRKEVEVVKEERRLRTEDNPTALTLERFLATAWTNAPYHNPIIGWMTDLDSLTVDDLRAWYRRWYSPSNALLVVVGDVEPKAVLRLARRHFGALPASPVPKPKPRTEVEQHGERRITVHAPAEVPYLIMGWKAPHLDPAHDDDWEPYALEVLASILANGENSRLQKHLVRGLELATSADADYSAFSLHDGLFVIDAVPSDGTDMATLEQALLEQIERLKREPVGAEELARIKAGVVASEIYQRDSVQHQAVVLGMLATLGYDPALMDRYAERIRAVTAEQVQAVARKYLVPRHRTVAILAPDPIDPRHPPSHFSGELRR